MNRIGAMTVACNEEATVGFVIGAVLPHVDYYCYVDTGSTDHSLEIITNIFKSVIDTGKLEVLQVDIGPQLAMSKARQAALDNLRSHGIDFFLALDGDDVMYNGTTQGIVQLTQSLDPNAINNIGSVSHELYQSTAETSREWLANLLGQDNIFYEMTLLNGHAHQYGRPNRMQNTHDAFATGDWTDETRGKRPEAIYHSVSRGEIRGSVPILAHYGWARPNIAQREKALLRYGQREQWNPRVEKLHLEPYRTNTGLVGFHNHPEIFRILGPRILEIL